MTLSLPASSFYGVDASERHAGIHLTESAYPAGLRMRSHSHEYAYLGIVLSGSYDETIGSRTLHRRTLTAVFHPAGEAHSVAFHEKAVRIFRVQLDFAKHSFSQLTNKMDRSLDFNGGAIPALALKLRREFLFSDKWSPVAIEGLTLEIAAELGRMKTRDRCRKPPIWLEKVRERLAANLTQSLSLDTLAAEAGVHPVHIAREFRKHYGVTMGEFLRASRIQFACRRIAASNQSLTEIALAAGFCDHSHFSNTFRRVIGMTPAQYRATLPRS